MMNYLVIFGGFVKAYVLFCQNSWSRCQKPHETMIREVKSAHINLFTILLTAFKCFKSPLDGDVTSDVCYEPDTSHA